jgi:hypothetical protein
MYATPVEYVTKNNEELQLPYKESSVSVSPVIFCRYYNLTMDLTGNEPCLSDEWS